MASRPLPRLLEIFITGDFHCLFFRFNRSIIWLITICLFHRCANDESMLSCAKPKLLKYLTDAIELERLPITQDLSIVRSRSIPEDNDFDEYLASQHSVDPQRREQLRSLMLEKLDTYLASHTIEAKLPEAIVGSDIVPRSLVESVPSSISIPLSDTPNGNGKLLNSKILITTPLSFD